VVPPNPDSFCTSPPNPTPITQRAQRSLNPNPKALPPVVAVKLIGDLHVPSGQVRVKTWSQAL